MNAAFKGTLPSVRCLVDNGADVNARDEDGATALELAVSGGHWEVVKWLLDKGADVNTRDRFGKTPLTMAASRGLLQIAELLKRHGAKG
jgi:ankyrin repeat protein